MPQRRRDRAGDSKKGSKIRKEKGETEGGRGERAEIAELIVKVSTRKPSQDSHSATC